MNNTTKAVVAAVVFLLLVIVLVVALHKSAREYAPAVDAAILSEFSSGIDKYLAERHMTENEPSTRLVEEPSSEEVTTEPETTTERKTIEQTVALTTTEVYDVEDYDYHGGYIGRFRLTAYEWTGNPMANGEYPYYGVCACNRPELWGKYLYIDGHGTFKVCDRGGGLGDDTIDIYLGDPDACEKFGIQYADVYYG